MNKKINIKIYFISTWLFSVYLTTNFLTNVPTNTLIDNIHYLLVVFTYALMYQLPAIITYISLNKFIPTRFYTILSLVVLLSALGHIFVFADSRLYDLYGFHINGFVWNLITTPGGIESLEADQTNYFTVIFYLSTLLGVHIGAIIIATKLEKLYINSSLIILFFTISTLAERGIYGVSQATIYGPVLERAEALPFYQPTKIRSLVKLLGIDTKKNHRIKLNSSIGSLHYPKHQLDLTKVNKPFNIIVLVSESMRWDLMKPEIMPGTSNFAKDAWNFTNHFSTGNGTREGLFGLFYGIYGSYWEHFLRNSKGPVIFDILNKYNYQYFIHTSASFTYPEFDRTIFRDIPKENLVENNKEEPWVRDNKNTSELLLKIKNREQNKPYFGFIFYEATHARYSFNEKQAIFKNYLKTLDYSNLTREQISEQIDGMLARYKNAAHSIDGEINRIIQYLKDSGELSNTIVVITGDHGEEFMENGRWGHNSSFSDWQVKVPMVLWIPDLGARNITERTSHLDITPTLLKLLGVANPTKDYSLGHDLLSPKQNRNIVVASWSDIGLINDHGKLVIPFKSTTQHQNLVTDLHDKVISSEDVITNMQPIIFSALADAKYYSK